MEQTYNLTLLAEYLDYLGTRLKELEQEPFAQTARMKLRQEIESITSVLEQQKMQNMWEKLNQTFGCSSAKPDAMKEFVAPLPEASKFRMQMEAANSLDLIGEEDAF